MKVTIITVCYRAGGQLAETIDSVRTQTHPDIEHIVVDGASPDEPTRAVLARYADGRCRMVSEPDQGVYDAMNKGLRMATGEVVGFMNAGDLLAAPDVVARLVAEFQRAPVDALFGDAYMVDPADISRVRRYWKERPYDRDRFLQGWMPPHLGTYIRRAVYQRLGAFRTDLKVAADYELLLRFFYFGRITARHIPLVVVRFRLGGASNRDPLHIWRANREVRRAWQLNGQRPPFLIELRKPLGKLLQYLHRPSRS